MKTRIVIRTRFEAVHQYEDCPIKGVEYLKYPHRHMFYVEVKFAVTHDNREIEFLTMKAQIDKYLSENYDKKFLFSKSCEMIAEDILSQFNASFVSVFEDNENGSEVYYL
jgi:6-pyruvoyl-tetrahydropterin synthase